MKSISRLLVVLLLGLGHINLFGTDDFSTTIKIVNKELHLSLDQVVLPATIKIQDEAGNVMKAKKITNQSFNAVISLTGLTNGAYMVIVKSKEQETIQPFNLTKAGIVMDKEEKTTFYPAIFSLKGSKLKFSLLNPANKTVRIFILDQTGKVRYQNKLEGRTVIEKAFNLRDLPQGSYTFIVDNTREVYTRSIHLQ